eukprot:m.77884 g.77884  ORF g.77884 m.77884 type:complete len:79 (-) comp11931_c0_seq6:981-1217(-)
MKINGRVKLLKKRILFSHVLAEPRFLVSLFVLRSIVKELKEDGEVKEECPDRAKQPRKMVNDEVGLNTLQDSNGVWIE